MKFFFPALLAFPLLAASVLALVPPAAAEPLLPPGWDPALAGDAVMERLVTVTAPEVKGAHDAEMVILDRHAYLVAEVNDENAGESPRWAEIYSALSIVNLDTLEVEAILPFARSEEAFENETLPVGACFVPRVIRKDEGTLRCYFASERPDERQSQMWYRDFDLETRTFAPTIHQAMLQTSLGTFEMQPQHFHDCAAAHGFEKEAKDYGLYLFDSFKVFDGRTYVAINNFPGKQNALALVHEDLVTFEILGHFNEPQSVNLSESAVNRLPEGTWMAICRQDGGNGNYHFTTSEDGVTWAAGEELPFVPNGANSKPTFDRFGELYYLGWQESTQIQGVHRSVFNLDISRDGRTWERKYRFETPKSFQYPTFREHEGVVWLCATQGDHSRSRKERIVFGKLEDLGAYESQEGRERVSWPVPELPPPPPVEVDGFKLGAKLFTDRDYIATEVPELLEGLPFLRAMIDPVDVACTVGGTVYALTPSARPRAASRSRELVEAGFEKLDLPEFQLFPGEINRVEVYRKTAATGERFRFAKVVLFLAGEGARIEAAAP